MKTATCTSAIYRGAVVHRRFRPVAHKLRYRMFSLLLDIDELEALDRSLWGFSHNRFNILGFYDRDHGSGTATSLRTHVEARLQSAGIGIAGGRVTLLCMPRILGYVFNPLSVYFCERPGGGIAAILYEVNNTFGERHDYLVPIAADQAAPESHFAPKAFHVSPFLPIKGMIYRFRVAPPGPTVSIAVHVHDADGPVLTAALASKRTPLTNAALFKTFLMYPLLTLTVIAGIHWEALKLWLKGAPVQTKPLPPENPVTIGQTDIDGAASHVHAADLRGRTRPGRRRAVA